MKKQTVPRDIIALSSMLDAQFKGPFNIRFGIDSIIGLVPFVGDLTSLMLSHYVLIRSVMIKCPLSILIKMAINIYIDFVVGCIPIVGDIFDVYWKANTRNTALLGRYLDSPKKTQKSSRISIILISLIPITIMAVLIYSIFKLSQLLLASF